LDFLSFIDGEVLFSTYQNLRRPPSACMPCSTVKTLPATQDRKSSKRCSTHIECQQADALETPGPVFSLAAPGCNPALAVVGRAHPAPTCRTDPHGYRSGPSATRRRQRGSAAINPARYVRPGSRASFLARSDPGTPRAMRTLAYIPLRPCSARGGGLCSARGGGVVPDHARSVPA